MSAHRLTQDQNLIQVRQWCLKVGLLAGPVRTWVGDLLEIGTTFNLLGSWFSNDQKHISALLHFVVDNLLGRIKSKLDYDHKSERG
jgi:hypothetical protein